MAAVIETVRIADSDTQQRIRETVGAFFATHPETYTVSIEESRPNPDWVVRLQSPDGRGTCWMFYPTDGEHRPGHFEEKLARMLDSLAPAATAR